MDILINIKKDVHFFLSRSERSAYLCIHTLPKVHDNNYPVFLKEFAFHSSTALSSDVNELIYEEYISFNLNKLPNYFKLQYHYTIHKLSEMKEEEVPTKVELIQEFSETESNVARSSSNSVTIDEVNSKVDFLSNCHTLFEPPIGFRDKYGDFSCFPIEIYIPDSLKPYIKCVALYAMLSGDNLYIDFRYGDSLVNVSQLAAHGFAYYIAKSGKITNLLEIDAKHYSTTDQSITDCGEKFYFYVDERIVSAIKDALDRRKQAERISGSVNTYLRPCTLTPDPTSSQEGFVLYHGDLSEKFYYLSKTVQPNICDFLENRQIVVEKRYAYSDVLSIESKRMINKTFSVEEPVFNFTRIKICQCESDVETTVGTLCVLKQDVHIHISNDPVTPWLAIEGNGHKVDFYTHSQPTTLVSSIYRSQFVDSQLCVPALGNCIIDQDFNPHMVSRTESWQADHVVLFGYYNFSVVRTSPDFIGDTSHDNVYVPVRESWVQRVNIQNAYINWTGSYLSFDARVKYITRNEGKYYAVIDYNNSKSDGGYNLQDNKPSVIMYNCYDADDTFWVSSNGQIHLPINVTTAYYIKDKANVKKLYLKHVYGTCGDYNDHIGMKSICSEEQYIDSCKFIHFIMLEVEKYRQSIFAHQTVKNTEIAYVSGHAIYAGRLHNSVFTGCHQHITGCYIHDTGYNRKNHGAIRAGWFFHIHDNVLLDNGYSSIWLGENNHLEGTNLECYSSGCIEKNNMGQTEQYYRNSVHNNLFDSGCIYIATMSNGIVIRHNVINRYAGRGENRGIFGDDGAACLFIYENIIRQTPNGHSIDVRYADNRRTTEGNTLCDTFMNTHRLVACNTVDSAIRIEGKNGETTSCDVHAFSNVRLTGNELALDTYKDLTTMDDNIRIKGIINSDGTLSVNANYNAITSDDSPLRGEEHIHQ